MVHTWQNLITLIADQQISADYHHSTTPARIRKSYCTLPKNHLLVVK